MASSIVNAPVFDPASTCLARKHLTKAYWLKARDLRSRSGCTLQDMLRSGVENSDSEIGVYAGDADCYEVFSGFLDPLLADYHGLDKELFHVTSAALEVGDLNLKSNEILSTRIRVARNLQGHPFTPRISRRQRSHLEVVVSRAL